MRQSRCLACSFSDQRTEQRASRCRLHCTLSRFWIRFLGGEHSRSIDLSPNIYRTTRSIALDCTRAGRSGRRAQLDNQDGHILVWMCCSPGMFVHRLRCLALLISLQVLSGKQPWSEVREDSAIVLRLAKGHTPGRPESRTLNDLHWNLIQDCWSEIEERPAAEVIISTIEQFLSHCPQSPPLRDLLPAWSSEANVGAKSLSSVSYAPTAGSRSHEDDQNRYIVMIILVHSAILTPQYLHLPVSHRSLM